MNETLGDRLDVRQLDCAVYGLSVCGKGLDVAQQYADTIFEALQRYKAHKSELMYDSLNQQAYVSSLLWSQARILTWRGDLEEASAMLRDVVNLGCCPAAFDDLARIEWRLGRKELALEFAQFRIRGKSIPTVHLLKCVPKQDGRVAVHHSTSLSAAMMVSAVAPEEFPVFAAH